MSKKKLKKIDPEKSNTNIRVRKSNDYFYDTPDSKLLTILIIVFVLMSAIFLYLFKYVTQECNFNDSSNACTAVYLSIVGVPVGVTLSFIVALTWGTYTNAATQENEEATQILLLYNMLLSVSGTERIRRYIREYLEFIINVEFPQIEDGIQSPEGLDKLLEIGKLIYKFEPQNKRDVVLYNDSIRFFERIMTLRIARYGYITGGISPELWWVLIFGVIIVIIMSFFMYCESWSTHIILTMLSVAVLVAIVFLIISLDYPYRGDFGLDSIPFQLVLFNINKFDEKLCK